MTSYFGPLEDIAFGIGNKFNYDGFKLWIERQQWNFSKSISIGGDLISANWDGASPLDLSSRDAAATSGWALDSSEGAAQFVGQVYIDELLQVGNPDQSHFVMGPEGFTMRYGSGQSEAERGSYLWSTRYWLLKTPYVADDTALTPRLEFVSDSTDQAMRFYLSHDSLASGTTVPNYVASIQSPTASGNTAVLELQKNGSGNGRGLVIDASSGHTGEIMRMVNRSSTARGMMSLVNGSGTYFFELYSDGQVRLVDGTASAPSISNLGDENVGMYFPAADTIGWSTEGTQRLTLATRGLQVVDGTASAPSYGFLSDPDTGMFWISADRIGWSAGGTTLIDIGTVAGTGLRSVAVRDVTTGSAASVFINATTGQMARSTSTLADKSFVTEDVRNVLKYRLRPNRHFRKDDQRWRYGFIAEWIAEIDPNLGEYDDFGNIVNYDTRGIQAVLAAKIERLEDFVRSLPSGLRAGWIE